MPEVGERVSVLRDVRTLDGTPVDVHIGPSGSVTELRSAARRDAPADASELVLSDWLVLPAAAEPHAHLDKALTWSATGARYGDLHQAIRAWNGYAATMTEQDVADRARRAVRAYLAAGFTAMRSHVNVVAGADDPLCGVRALVALRDELRQVFDLQVCLLPDHHVQTSLIEQAMDLGVDLLGGSPHRAPNPVIETNRLLSIAQHREVPIDLHTDEDFNPAMRSIVELARQVRTRGLRRRVTASHCVSLGTLADPELAEVLEHVRAAGMFLVALPITNLYLQARRAPAPVPRGLAPVRQLLAAGIPVAAGGDNLRDPFNPMGRADPFETTSLLITAAHLTAEQALDAVTATPRAVLGLPPAGIQPGRVADLMVVQAEDLTAALAGAVGSRVVLRRGRLVASTSVDRSTALDD
ncbi:MAG TPA: amidohydrolase family protein [Pseudonocardia sp.]|jgi:cytosine deaminase|nr:amidohydrolase family protein [Pseudonocardia sp.]